MYWLTIVILVVWFWNDLCRRQDKTKCSFLNLLMKICFECVHVVTIQQRLSCLLITLFPYSHCNERAFWIFVFFIIKKSKAVIDWIFHIFTPIPLSIALKFSGLGIFITIYIDIMIKLLFGNWNRFFIPQTYCLENWD